MSGTKPDEGKGPEVEVRWVECPRDAWQALPRRIPAEWKQAHLRNLLTKGLRNIDLGSFVSPRAVPQLADTEEVLEGLERPPGADLICIVANRRGLQRAIATGKVTSIGYPLSVNETFQLRNTGNDLAESRRVLAELTREAHGAGIDVVVYLSMGLGNPYGEPWRPSDTATAAHEVRAMGVTRVAVADTAGTAEADTVAATVAAVIDAVGEPAAVGVHLHSRPDAWEPPLRAAWDAGVRWFEGALSGAGGCPFATDHLVGNLPTEMVLPWLMERTAIPGRRPNDLQRLADEARLLTRYGSGEEGIDPSAAAGQRIGSDGNGRDGSDR